MVASPSNPDSGVKVRLPNAVLTSASDPIRVTMLVPFPLTWSSPVTVPSVTVPSVTVRVTAWSWVSPSAIEMPVIALSAVSPTTVGVEGNVVTGAKLLTRTPLSLKIVSVPVGAVGVVCDPCPLSASAATLPVILASVVAVTVTVAPAFHTAPTERPAVPPSAEAEPAPPPPAATLSLTVDSPRIDSVPAL